MGGAEVAGDPLGKGVEGVPVGYVEGFGDQAVAAQPQAVGGFLQADLIHVAEGEPGAGGGQIPGQGPADARAGAGDHCYFILEVFHSCCSDSV